MVCVLEQIREEAGQIGSRVRLDQSTAARRAG
jgi:hypothetical protein